MFRVFLGVLVIMIAIGPLTACGNNEIVNNVSGVNSMIEFKEGTANPPILKDLKKKYTATIEVEGKGQIVIELFAKDVPIAVSNFVYLADKGYYNNTTFHRVIENFMAQGGDPTGTGTGGPGYTFGLEITNHKHATGAVSMANTGRPNSNGSQFFICFAPQTYLDGKYSVFGQVIKGMEVVKKISLRDPQTAKLPGDKVKTITISVE